MTSWAKAHSVEGGTRPPGQRPIQLRKEQNLPGKESPSSKASEMLIKVVDSGRTGTALAYVDQDMVPQDKAKRATSKRISRLHVEGMTPTRGGWRSSG